MKELLNHRKLLGLEKFVTRQYTYRICPQWSKDRSLKDINTVRDMALREFLLLFWLCIVEESFDDRTVFARSAYCLRSITASKRRLGFVLSVFELDKIDPSGPPLQPCSGPGAWAISISFSLKEAWQHYMGFSTTTYSNTRRPGEG